MASASSPAPAGDSGYRALQVAALSSSIDRGIEQLRLNRLQRKPLKAGQVRVRVAAACVNYFDLLMLMGRYQVKPPLPFTLGSEGSGRVVECGPGVSQWKVGDAVIMAMAMGCMAEEVAVSAADCVPAPASFTWAESAGFGVGFYTAYNGLVQRGHMRRGEWLLVTGAGGGMGLAAVQLGVRLGARVVAIASSADKLAAATQCGAEATIASSDDWKECVKAITGGLLIDVLYDVVGGDTFDRCLSLMAGGGRMLVVGFTGGRVQSVPANLVLVKGISVVGVRAGADMRVQPEVAEEMNRRMRELTEGEGARSLAPVVDSQVEAEHFQAAYRRIASRAVIGKAVVLWSEEALKQQTRTVEKEERGGEQRGEVTSKEINTHTSRAPMTSPSKL